MLERRNVIGSGLVAGVAGLLGGGPVDAAQGKEDDGAVADAVDRLRRTVEQQFDACALGTCPHIDAVRRQQRTFLKTTQKYPEYIEVGIDVWESVYDWHVKHQQPVQAGRAADGRYMMLFMFTNLLLRPDQAPTYVGYGFDK